MRPFFKNIINKQNAIEWLDFLDWILSENKFNGWEPSQKGRLTKNIKALCNELDIEYVKNVIKEKYPQRLPQKAKILLSGNNSSEELIRHIRNGIAHRNAEFKSTKLGNAIVLKDYFTNDGKKNKKGDMSAYIYIPELFLFELYKLYKEEIGK